MTELTFALLKYGFLILLWVFAWLAVRSLRKDIESFSPRPSRSRQRRKRRAHQASSATANAMAEPQRSNVSSPRPTASGNEPAGSSIPLSGEAITMGRSASNTVVLDDEFVSSHHARIYPDAASGQWVIEDLGSTNGTIVNDQRLNVPTILPPRMPVRIGATTFELR